MRISSVEDYYDHENHNLESHVWHSFTLNANRCIFSDVPYMPFFVGEGGGG